MLRSSSLVAIALVSLTAPATAQGPRLSPRPWPSFSVPALPLGQPAARWTSTTLVWPADSKAVQRTYWLEGGLVGAVVAGVVGSQLCHLGTNQSCFSLPAFVLFGGAVGLPAGAIIGGQFPKR